MPLERVKHIVSGFRQPPRYSVFHAIMASIAMYVGKHHINFECL